MFDTTRTDGKPQWRLVYDAVRTMPVDGVITYDELDEILARPSREDRSPITKAIQELEANDQRTMTNVRGRGYRIARADEHLGLAKRSHRSARRALSKAASKVRSADRSGLDQNMRNRLDAAEVNLAAQAALWTRLDAKVETQDRKIQELARRAEVEKDRRDDEMAVVQRRLAALERKTSTIAVSGGPAELTA